MFGDWVRFFSLPFIFELVTQFKDFDLYLSLAVVLQDALVRLSLPVTQAVEVFGVGRGAVARFDVCEVALDVARGAGASRGGKAYIVGHGGEERMVNLGAGDPELVLSEKATSLMCRWLMVGSDGNKWYAVGVNVFELEGGVPAISAGGAGLGPTRQSPWGKFWWGGRL